MKTKTKIKRKWGKVKSYYKVNRGALWFAFIAGIIAAIILINSLFNAPETSPQPQEQTNGQIPTQDSSQVMPNLQDPAIQQAAMALLGGRR